jgi:hypothetical protein
MALDRTFTSVRVVSELLSPWEMVLMDMPEDDWMELNACPDREKCHALCRCNQQEDQDGCT